MQEDQEFYLDNHIIKSETDLENIIFPLSPGDRIFFYGDLGSGKSTFIRTLLRRYLGDKSLLVRSPTYTYFQKYSRDIYHFDLYRLSNYEDFFLIGGDDILLNHDNISLIEWPEMLSGKYVPTLEIFMEKVGETERKISFRRPK